MKFSSLFIFLFLLSLNGYAIEQVVDPLDSPSWQRMHELMLNHQTVLFDDKVIVSAPDFAEDAMNVPVSVKVVGLDKVEEVIVFADLNPIQKVLSFEPLHIQPRLSFRIKVEQATPIRAAARTFDGVWHVGGKWIEAAGGGCTTPSRGRTKGDWSEYLMDVSSRMWFKNEKLSRVRFRIMHPMDTGLAPGIPEFYLQQFDVIDDNGQTLVKLKTYEPVSENPIFTVDMNKGGAQSLKLLGRDNNGNVLEAKMSR